MIKLCEKQRKGFPEEILTPNHERWDEFVLLMMNSKSRCDDTLKGTAAILWDMRDIDIQGTLEYFESIFWYCDCEVLLNVVLMHSHRDYCNSCNTLAMHDTMINLHCNTQFK
jgi:hypothetical protein